MNARLLLLFLGLLVKGWGLIRELFARKRAEAAVRTEAQLEGAEAYIETRERIDNAEIVGDDPDAARRWLRERAAGAGPAEDQR